MDTYILYCGPCEIWTYVTQDSFTNILAMILLSANELIQ